LPVRLDIAVEAHWKGTVLETLNPVATLPLRACPDQADLLALDEPHEFVLANGERLTVWCARTATGRFVLEIKSGRRTLVHTEANAPISARLVLTDGKHYEFSVLDMD
jgi:hypothetical protein